MRFRQNQAMPVSREFAALVSERLSEVRPVRIKPMFGGLGIYHGDVFFAVADDDRLFFKVSPETVGEYDGFGMGPWVLGGTENLKYREVPPAIFEDPSVLGGWIDAATAAAESQTKAGKKRKPAA
jgi:DNA transformation protein and related proteins